MRSIKIFKIIIPFGLILFSCAPDKIEKESPFSNSVTVGKVFRLNLKEDHSKGETWVLTDDFNHAIIEHISTVWHGPDKGIDVNFKALSVGQVSLNLQLIKQKDTTDVKQFIVEIRSK